MNRHLNQRETGLFFQSIRLPRTLVNEADPEQTTTLILFYAGVTSAPSTRKVRRAQQIEIYRDLRVFFNQRNGCYNFFFGGL